MTSTIAAKCAANQSKSRQSTGPVTEAGKTKMRDNALRHGLTSKHVVIRGEDPEEYEALRQDLLNDWKPADTQEEMLVAQIAESAWRLMRVRRVETRTYDNYILVAEKLNAAGIAKCSPHRTTTSQLASTPAASSSTTSAATRPPSSVPTTAPSLRSGSSRKKGRKAKLALFRKSRRTQSGHLYQKITRIPPNLALFRNPAIPQPKRRQAAPKVFQHQGFHQVVQPAVL